MRYEKQKRKLNTGTLRIDKVDAFKIHLHFCVDI